VVHLARLAFIGLYTVVVGTAACLVALVDRSGRAVVVLGRLWVRAILRVCHVRVEVSGLENVSSDQPQIFMSNHQSVFDIAAIIQSLPVPWRFVAKKELTWIPFFGWALVLSGQIIVDRGNRERAVRSLSRGAQRIRDGVHVIIFPEGTRSETGELGSFKSGGFHLALEAGVPVVPVGVVGSRDVTPKRSLRVHGGTVRVVYGKPIPTADFDVEHRGELKEAVRQGILACLDRAGRERAAAGGAARPRGRD